MGARIEAVKKIGGLFLFASAFLGVACESSSSGDDDDDDSGDPRGGCSNPLGGFCICDDMPPPIDEVSECSAATMGGPVVCCDDGTSCSCGLFLCDSTATSCNCTSVGVGTDGVTSCTGTLCCAAEGGTCFCGLSQCFTGSAEVPSCSTETARCSAGETRVEKCVPR